MYIIDEAARNGFRSAMQKSSKKNVRTFFGVIGRRIENREDIKDACHTVYEAGVPFQTAVQPYKYRKDTISGRKTSLNYHPALDFLVVKIYNYFNNTTPNTPNTEESFDKFHAELCDGFLELANDDRHSKGLFDDLTYGNAQKLVNMTFKYLTTFEDYPVFSDLFEYCHMPIDSNILVFFHSIGVSNCSGKFYPKRETVAEAHYNGIPWTDLDSPDDYKQLVRDYRRVLSERHHNFTMLHLECYIWDSMTRRNTLEIAPVPGATLPGTKTHFYM